MGIRLSVSSGAGAGAGGDNGADTNSHWETVAADAAAAFRDCREKNNYTSERRQTFRFYGRGLKVEKSKRS